MTPTARQMLEAAIGRAAGSQHYEVTIEHLLSQMIQPDDGDIAALYLHFGKNRTGLQNRVEKILQHMNSGNASRPVFSGSLWKLVTDAWMHGSLEHGTSMIRSGHLFYCLVRYPGRYIGEVLPELEDWSVEELDR